jgi:hypothetical protein
MGGYYYGQTKSIYPSDVWRIHTDRAAGGNSYHCTSDGDIAAQPDPGKETGENRFLSGSAQAVGRDMVDVLR